MNFIPTTFSGLLPSYTAVGGMKRRAFTGLSAVILHRGDRLSRFSLFESLDNAGFDYVVSIESGQYHYDIEGLSKSFPFVRFIILKEPLSHGEEINIAAMEVSSPMFFVLWNDISIIRSGGAERIADRFLSGTDRKPLNTERVSPVKRLCTIPLIQNMLFDTMPTLSSPAMIKRKFTAIHSAPAREGEKSLYPYDGLGIYDRERFIRIGGFDNNIKNFYWQLMDFGFRAFLWGEKIAATLAVKLAYENESPESDTIHDEHFRRFYLKNLVPVYRGEFANIPLRKFPGYLLVSGKFPVAAWKEFSEGRCWVEANQRCFNSDARLLIDTWDISEEEN